MNDLDVCILLSALPPAAVPVLQRKAALAKRELLLDMVTMLLMRRNQVYVVAVARLLLKGMGWLLAGRGYYGQGREREASDDHHNGGKAPRKICQQKRRVGFI